MITLIAMLRIFPYALAGLLAWQKGYKRLSLAMVYIIGVALYNFYCTPTTEARALLASLFALLIGWHAADLTPKRRR